jgi:hypothetical protein
VKLIEGSQLLRQEPLFLWSEDREHRLQPLAQAGRSIVVAHAIKDIRHCQTPMKLQVLAADI